MAAIFQDRAEVYEAMIHWPNRLAREGPFYRKWFRQVGVRRVIDVACGTGHHAAMFGDWGLEVEGADVSDRMVARARARFGESGRLRWVVRGFEEPIDAVEPFDAAVCVGNSLALAPDHATAGRAVRQMLAALRPGGLIVLHVLNLWHLPDGPSRWQKCLRRRLGQRDVLILKGVHRCGQRGYVDLLVASLAGQPQLETATDSFLGFEPPELEQMARSAGAATVEVYGSYREEPYVRQQSEDLVLVGLKG